MPASSDNDSPVRDMSSVSMSVSSDRETTRGPQQTRQTRQTRQKRHPPKNISAADAEKKKYKARWSNAETNALISAVDKHGLKWTSIKRDPQFNHCLINRSNIDLKDKWRNIITKDSKNNFTSAALDKLHGPVKWLKHTQVITKAIQKHNYSLSDFKRLSLKKHFYTLRKLGEIGFLTMYRSSLNQL